MGEKIIAIKHKKLVKTQKFILRDKCSPPSPITKGTLQQTETVTESYNKQKCRVMEHSAEGLICNIKPESKSQEGLRKCEGLEEYKRQREKEFANRLYILVM